MLNENDLKMTKVMKYNTDHWNIIFITFDLWSNPGDGHLLKLAKKIYTISPSSIHCLPLHPFIHPSIYLFIHLKDTLLQWPGEHKGKDVVHFEDKEKQ